MKTGKALRYEFPGLFKRIGESANVRLEQHPRLRVSDNRKRPYDESTRIIVRAVVNHETPIDWRTALDLMNHHALTSWRNRNSVVESMSL